MSDWVQELSPNRKFRNGNSFREFVSELSASKHDNLRWSRKNGDKTLFAPFIFSFQFQLKFQRTFVAQT